MHGAVGTDIVSVPRIAALLQERGEAFRRRWFTAGEISYCSRKAVPARHFAARLAAKEACVKALRMGWDGPLPWPSIEIVSDPRGAPSVRLAGAVLRAAVRAGVGQISVSLSHCDEYATAIAVLAPGCERAGAAGSAAADGGLIREP